MQKEVTATEICICKGLLLKKLRQRATHMQGVTRRESRPPPTPSSVFPHGNLLLKDNVFLVAHQGALSSQ